MEKTYYGTKRITAWPEVKTPHVPSGAEPIPPQEGYGVRYADGYTSWSPKQAFEDAYKPADAMNFQGALTALKSGLCVARSGWNGKDMFIYLVPGSTFQVNRAPLLGIFPEGTEINYLPHIDMKDAEGKCVPWLASQTDILACDWMVVESVTVSSPKPDTSGQAGGEGQAPVA